MKLRRKRSGQAVRLGSACFEPVEARLLLSGVLSGTVWQDVNSDGVRDSGEAGLVGWGVYLDQDHNGVKSAGETGVVTAADGSYSFGSISAGKYFVGVQAPFGWGQTRPGSSAAHDSAADIGVVASSSDHAVAVTSGGGPSLSAADLTALGVRTNGSKAIASISGEHVVKRRVVSGRTMAARSASATSSGDSAADSPVGGTAGALIGLDAFRADPRFAGITGAGGAIAVLDSGIDLANGYFGPDANGNGIADRIKYQYDFVYNDTDASDNTGHGTHVTSIAAGQDAINGGIAPGADLIILKVLNDNGNGEFSQIEQALQWVIANAASYKIVAVNMSLGDQKNYATSQQLYGIDDELAALAAQGVIVAAAAGNSYSTYKTPGVAYPAADPNALGVGMVYDSNIGTKNYGTGIDATTGADRMVVTSQRSSSLVDILAPGAAIIGAAVGGGTVTQTGTSQATPIISGAAALAQQIAQQHLGRRLTPAEFRTVLRASADTVYDGDDEDDNVPNSNADYSRINAARLGEAILALAGEVYTNGYIVNVQNTAVSSLDFGMGTSLAMPVVKLTSETDTGISQTDFLTSFNNAQASKALTLMVSKTTVGATVGVYADGVLIGGKIADASVTFITTNGSTALTDGTHDLTVRQWAPTSTSTSSPAIPLTIDTQAPPTPGAIDLSFTTDSGVSSSDNITNNTAPLFLLQAPAGPYIRLLRDGLLTGPEFASGLSLTATTQPNGTFSYAMAAVDEAGNVSAAGLALSVTIDTVASPSVAGLDVGFGTAGVALVQNAPLGGQIRAVIPLPDGRMVVVGDTGELTGSYTNRPMVMALTADGQLDTTFGQGGITLPPLGYGQLDAAVRQPDGKLLVTGIFGSTMKIVRLNANGTIDTAWGDNGVISSTGAESSNSLRMALQPDGKIVIAGKSLKGFSVVRHLPDGSRDGSFVGYGSGTDGFASVEVNQGSFGALALTPDGGIIVGGSTRGVDGGDMYMTKLTSTGWPDFSFNGSAVSAALPGSQVIDGIAFTPDGKIMVSAADYNFSTGARSVVLARYSAKGAIDPTFNNGAPLSVANTSGKNAVAMALQADGKIVLALSSTYFSAARVNIDGTLDTTFASTGIWSAPHTGTPHTVVIQPDGKIVVAGYLNQGLGAEVASRSARELSDSFREKGCPGHWRCRRPATPASPPPTASPQITRRPLICPPCPAALIGASIATAFCPALLTQLAAPLRPRRCRVGVSRLCCARSMSRAMNRWPPSPLI